MAYAWFICPYNRRIKPESWVKHTRYCAMDDFTPQIMAEGGWWAESEVLGNVAVVKVRASDALLATIAGTAGYYRILAKWNLDGDTLADLTQANYSVIRSRLRQMGYTDDEIDAALGASRNEWRMHTFEDLLNLVASKRLKPRYDALLDDLVFEGEARPCRSIRSVDQEVQ